FGTGVDDYSVITATARKYTKDSQPWSTSEFSAPMTASLAPAGSATGGGWYFQPIVSSPPPTPVGSGTERAQFGVSALIQNKPSGMVFVGQTNFRYRPGGLHFVSTEYTS